MSHRIIPILKKSDGILLHAAIGIKNSMSLDKLLEEGYWDDALNDIAVECRSRYMATYGDDPAFYDLLYWLVYGALAYTLYIDTHRAYDTITASTAQRLLHIAEGREHCESPVKALNVRAMLRNDFAQRLTMLCDSND